MGQFFLIHEKQICTGRGNLNYKSVVTNLVKYQDQIGAVFDPEYQMILTTQMPLNKSGW